MVFHKPAVRRDHVCMKILTHISRFLLGLIFLVFGLNGFLHFIPMPPPSGVAGQFLGAMFVSKYLLVVSGLQVISGALLLINRYVPLALTILGPIIVNILLFHGLMNPAGIGLAVFVTILWGVVFASVQIRRSPESLRRASKRRLPKCAGKHVSFHQPNYEIN